MSTTDRTKRVPGEQWQITAARKIKARQVKARRRAAKANHDLAVADAEMAALHATTEQRFGLALPMDPFLLDVLAMIEVRPDGAWHWTGNRNNQALATVRVQSKNGGPGERSVVRYLAQTFGLIEANDYGSLFPTGARDDVNPWRRVLRPADKPTGHADRWRKEVAS